MSKYKIVSKFWSQYCVVDTLDNDKIVFESTSSFAFQDCMKWIRQQNEENIT